MLFWVKKSAASQMGLLWVAFSLLYGTGILEGVDKLIGNHTTVFTMVTSLLTLGIFMATEGKAFDLTRNHLLLALILAVLFASAAISRSLPTDAVTLCNVLVLISCLPILTASLKGISLPIERLAACAFTLNLIALPSLNLGFLNFHDTGQLCNFLLIANIPSLVILTSRAAFGKWQLFALLNVGMLVVTLTAYESRAPFVTACVLCACCLLIYRNSFNARLLGGGVLALALVFVVVVTKGTASKASSAFGRQFIMKRASEMVLDNPASGTGVFSFKRAYNIHQGEYFKQKIGAMSDASEGLKREVLAGDTVNFAYSDLIQYSVELGIPAMLLLLAAICYCAYKDIRSDQNAGVGGILKIALLVLGIYNFPLEIYQLCALSCVYLVMPASDDSLLKVSRPRYASFVGALTVCFSFLLVSTADGVRRADQLRGASLSRVSKTALMGNVDYLFAQAMFLTEHDDYAESNKYLAIVCKSKVDYQIRMLQGDNFVGMQQFDKAGDAYTQSSYMVPNRLVPKYKLMALSQFRGDSALSNFWAREIISTPIKVPSEITKSIQFQASLKLSL